MTTIREAIALFASFEEGLEITEPQHVKIKRVYQFLPPARDIIETPCIMHQFRPITEERTNDVRKRTYAIRIQLLFAKLGPDTDTWSEVAAAFDDVLVTRLDAHVKLGRGEFYQRLFDFGGQEYQPTALEWNGIRYVGSQYEYELQVHDVIDFEA